MGLRICEASLFLLTAGGCESGCFKCLLWAVCGLPGSVVCVCCREDRVGMQGVLVGASVAGLYWLVAGQLRVVGGDDRVGLAGRRVVWAGSWARRWLVGLYRAVVGGGSRPWGMGI